MPILHDDVTISNQYSLALLICNRMHGSLHSSPMNDWLVYTYDEHCMMTELVRTWMASPVAVKDCNACHCATASSRQLILPVQQLAWAGLSLVSTGYA